MALAIGAAASWWITRTITGPIKAAVKVAETVSAGPEQPPVVAGGDETGQLMDALKDRNTYLVDIIDQVRSGTQTIATASSQIAVVLTAPPGKAAPAALPETALAGASDDWVEF